LNVLLNIDKPRKMLIVRRKTVIAIEQNEKQ